jgi:hypothetical protein
VRIKATLRNGNEYVLVFEDGLDPAAILTEVAAGRSQALRGWVRVEPMTGADASVVLGDEIVELHLEATGL